MIRLRRSPITFASSVVIPRNVALFKSSCCISQRACISCSRSSTVRGESVGSLCDNQVPSPIAPVLGHLRRQSFMETWIIGGKRRRGLYRLGCTPACVVLPVAPLNDDWNDLEKLGGEDGEDAGHMRDAVRLGRVTGAGVQCSEHWQSLGLRLAFL